MIRDEAFMAGGVDDTCCHSTPDGTPVFFFCQCGAIAAENPNYIGVILVPVGEPSAVGVCVDAIEHGGPFAPHLRHLVAPGWEQADEQPAVLRHFEGTVDEGEIFLFTLIAA